MKHPATMAASGLIAALAATGVFAEDCKTKVIDDNEKMKTLEHVCQPGDNAPMAKRGWRAFYLIEGGILERTYEDGSTETIGYKTGDSRSLADDKAFSYRNTGNSTMRFFIVYPK